MSVVFLYVLYDIYTRISVVMELRRILRAQGPMGVIADTMSGVMGSPENYIKMMNTHDEFVDHLFIQMTASILGQDIILLHVEVEFKVVVRDEEDHLRIGAEAEGPEDVKSD